MENPDLAGSEPSPLRRNRDFQVLWSSQVLSTLGSAATRVALPLLILAETGSAAQAGAVGFAQTLPFLVWFLPAGAWVDRWDRKRLMLTTEAARLVAIGGIAAMAATGNVSLWLVMVAAFVEGTGVVFFELAEAAALPHLVPKAQLPQAIAQNQGRQQGANLLGPPVGGALFGLGRGFPFGFDAITYLVSFVAVLSLRPALQGARDLSDISLTADIRLGLGWLWRQHFLRALSFVAAALNFTIPALVLALVVRAQELGADPARVGLLTSAFGIGAMSGVFFAPRIDRALSGRSIILIVCALWTVSLIGLAAAPGLLILGVIIVVVTSSTPTLQVMIGRYRYALTPDEMQGRMLSASRMLGWGAAPIGVAIAGVTIEVVGPSATMLALGGVMGVAALASSFAPGLKNDPLENPADPPCAEVP